MGLLCAMQAGTCAGARVSLMWTVETARKAVAVPSDSVVRLLHHTLARVQHVLRRARV
jgi:hypothetical protein